MTLIKGIPVIIIVQREVDIDPFGRPIQEEVQEIVPNVLVSPMSSEDVVNEQNLSGRRAIYQLAIPKGDQHAWEDAQVIFFGHRWRVIGLPEEGIDSLLPLDWNRKVKVERYE